MPTFPQHDSDPPASDYFTSPWTDSTTGQQWTSRLVATETYLWTPYVAPQSGTQGPPGEDAGGTSSVSTNPTSGSTITIPTTKEDHVRKIAASATISALNIALPSAANSRDCQTVAVVGNQIITTLTFTAGSGATIAGTASFATVAGTFYSFVFCLADNTWNRIA